MLPSRDGTFPLAGMTAFSTRFRVKPLVSLNSPCTHAAQAEKIADGTMLSIHAKNTATVYCMFQNTTATLHTDFHGHDNWFEIEFSCVFFSCSSLTALQSALSAVQQGSIETSLQIIGTMPSYLRCPNSQTVNSSSPREAFTHWWF